MKEYLIGLGKYLEDNKMIMKQELINKVKDYFNLNIYETKVWLALLGKGAASAGEIAKLSGVPRSRTYDVLESLEKKGFAMVKLGKPIKYLGIKPHLIVEKLKKETMNYAEKKIKTLSDIKETNEFVELQKIYNGGMDPIKKEEITTALKGKSNISNYLKEIFENAKKEVIMCLNVEEMHFKLRLFKDTLERLEKNGIKINIVLHGDENLIKEVEKKLERKVKKIKIEAKFFIIDREQILLYLSKDKKNSDETAIWLNSEFFSQAFSDLFEIALKGEK